MGNGRIVRRENKFTQVSNAVLRDEMLTFKAKGLYAVINSYVTIPNFILYKSFLMAHCSEGEKAFESVWKELKESGYLIQHKLHDNTGIIYYEYELLDEKLEVNNITKEQSINGKDEVNHTPKKQGVEKAALEKAHHGKSNPGKRGVYNNTDFNKILNNNTYGNKKDTHTGFDKERNYIENKDVCVNNYSYDNHLYLENLQKEIKDIIGERIGLGKLKEIVRTVPIERIAYHLENWHIHKKNQVKSGAGYFITVVSNDIEPIEPERKAYNQNKIPQRDNFEQREYPDEFYESCYTNFVDLGIAPVRKE